MINVSIVVRTYNEAIPLERLLSRLGEQQYDGRVEVIVVDNGSTDETALVAKRYGVKVVHLSQEDFSYPKSLNAGIAAASCPIVICTVAHACPVGVHWITSAVRHFDDPGVAGVYSYILPNIDATLYDKLLGIGYWCSRLRGTVRIRSAHMGVFGATNIALRRALWANHSFDERYGAGGEDTAWAAWALREGHSIVRDPAFTVRHSHYLRTFGQFRAQLKVWSSVRGSAI